MDQDSSTSSPPKADSVQLKILGENLDVLKEFSERLKLKLDPDNAQQVCNVQFLDGELLTEIHICILHQKFRRRETFCGRRSGLVHVKQLTKSP